MARHSPGHRNVAYRLYHAQTRWGVYDVPVDGVSLVDNHKARITQPVQPSLFSDPLRALLQKAGRGLPANR